MATPHPQPDTASDFALSTVFFSVVILLLTCGAVAAFVVASDIFLILALAVLFAVFLHQTSGWVAQYTSLNRPISLTIVTALYLLLLIAGVVMFGAQVDQQLDNAREHLDEAQAEFQKLCDDYPVLKSIVSSTPFVKNLIDNSSSQASSSGRSTGSEKNEETPIVEQAAIRNSAKEVASAFASLFQTTFGLLVNSMLIFFVGLFIASNPSIYRDGVVRMFPAPRRQRVRDIMNMMGETLWRWLLGRFGSMVVTGGGAGLLLFVMGVPMAITLGIVTALLTFIPNIGGLVSLMLATLFALPKGGTVVLVVVLGYLILQLIESYVITPLIQKTQVSLPPALLLATQAVMGVLFGLLGAAVASPFLAVTKVWVEEAYVKDVMDRHTPTA